MPKWLSALIDSNEKELKRLQPAVDRVNELEAEFERLSDEELRAKTDEFKSRYKDGSSLDELLPEAFAAVREAAKRTIGQRHFDVQLMGGVVLHQGKIAEMKTGEGKTLVATLPLYLNSLVSPAFSINPPSFMTPPMSRKTKRGISCVLSRARRLTRLILSTVPITSSALTTCGITWLWIYLGVYSVP